MLRAEKKSPSSSAAATTAAVMGGRTARVCDSCLCKRARWFCAADDAFLCQSCDVSVHSANQLARRHDRIRLETASFKSSSAADQSQNIPPWLKGFTRKARTPRPNNNKQILTAKASIFSIVPEIGNEEIEDDEEQNQFLNNHHHQQVPVFDEFDERENLLMMSEELEDFGDGFLPSEVDLAEFVADVESLLGSNQEQEEENRVVVKKNVKDEELVMEDCFNNNGLMESGNILDWEFKGEEFEEDENKVVPLIIEDEVEEEEEMKMKKKKKKKILLRLNYDAVIAAWDSQSSPYTTGIRPHFDFDHCSEKWPPGWILDNENGEKIGGKWGRETDGEREARVSRYREKRRTRLFSKKIRYQVRKLNAEKRPRMKGRFVKRSTSTSTSTPLVLQY